jgi:hypothetical protein
MRLKGLRSKRLLLHRLGPGTTDSFQERGVVTRPAEARGETPIDEIDVESRIAGKAALSPANNPPNFGSARHTATKQPEQSHLVFRDERRSNASRKSSARL